MTDEVMYKLLKAIETEAKTNKRQLAGEQEVVGLRRVNFFINDLLEKGLITTEGTTTNKRSACLYYCELPESLLISGQSLVIAVFYKFFQKNVIN